MGNLAKNGKVYHVWSGLDAFVFTAPDGEKIYLPYIPIIADSEEEARGLAAKVVNQKLEDQVENLSYENWVSHAEFKYNF